MIFQPLLNFWLIFWNIFFYFLCNLIDAVFYSKHGNYIKKLNSIYLIWSTFFTNTIFAFLSVSRVNQSRYKETTPQQYLKQYWSFGDCFWWSCMVTMCTKCFLKKAWFYLHSFPFVFCICKLSTMVAFYCIVIYKLTTIFTRCFLTWLHFFTLWNKIILQIIQKSCFTYRKNCFFLDCMVFLQYFQYLLQSPHMFYNNICLQLFYPLSKHHALFYFLHVFFFNMQSNHVLCLLLCKPYPKRLLFSWYCIN